MEEEHHYQEVRFSKEQQTIVIHRGEDDIKTHYYTLANRGTHSVLVKNSRHGCCLVGSAINHKSIVTCLLTDTFEFSIVRDSLEQTNIAISQEPFQGKANQDISEQPQYLKRHYHSQYVSLAGITFRLEKINEEENSMRFIALKEKGLIEVYELRGVRLKPLLKYCLHDKLQIGYIQVIGRKNAAFGDLILIRNKKLIHLSLIKRKETVLLEPENESQLFSHVYLYQTKKLFLFRNDSSIHLMIYQGNPAKLENKSTEISAKFCYGITRKKILNVYCLENWCLVVSIQGLAILDMDEDQLKILNLPGIPFNSTQLYPDDAKLFKLPSLPDRFLVLIHGGAASLYSVSNFTHTVLLGKYLGFETQNSLLHNTINLIVSRKNWYLAMTSGRTDYLYISRIKLGNSEMVPDSH